MCSKANLLFNYHQLASVFVTQKDIDIINLDRMKGEIRVCNYMFAPIAGSNKEVMRASV